MATPYKRYSGTEYTGEFRDNMVAAKARGDFLTASERLQLLKTTGKEDDPTLPRDERVWDGLREAPNSVIDFDD